MQCCARDVASIAMALFLLSPIPLHLSVFVGAIFPFFLVNILVSPSRFRLLSFFQLPRVLCMRCRPVPSLFLSFSTGVRGIIDRLS